MQRIFEGMQLTLVEDSASVLASSTVRSLANAAGTTTARASSTMSMCLAIMTTQRIHKKHSPNALRATRITAPPPEDLERDPFSQRWVGTKTGDAALSVIKAL
eukprot:2659274-Rhodomonas_salina.1